MEVAGRSYPQWQTQEELDCLLVDIKRLRLYVVDTICDAGELRGIGGTLLHELLHELRPTLPKDASLIEVADGTNCVLLKIHSTSFAPVPEGAEIPRVLALWR